MIVEWKNEIVWINEWINHESNEIIEVNEWNYWSERGKNCIDWLWMKDVECERSCILKDF